MSKEEKVKAMSFDITNVGGIRHASFLLAPGVNVLRGANAVGKTSAMEAVVRASGGKQALELRDGTERGIVTGPGVSLKVRKVVTVSGQAEVELADVGPLARLIDPGLKDSDAAARERIRALAEILELAVTDDSLQALSPGEATPIEWLRDQVNLDAVDDLLTASEKLKGRFHALARESESKADTADLELKIAGERCLVIHAAIQGKPWSGLGGMAATELSEMPVSEATTALDEGIREHERLVGRSEERTALEREKEQIRETLGPREAIVAYVTKCEELNTVQHDATATAQHARNKLDSVRRKNDLALVEAVSAVSIADIAQASAVVKHDESKIDLERANERGAQWYKSDAILSKPLEGPTPDELETLKVELVDARKDALWLSEQSEEYRKQQLEAGGAKRLRDAESEKADEFRLLAGAIPARLGEILRGAGADLTVVDGRLHSSEKPPRDFEHRLSTGERVALALDVAAASTAYANKVLPLDPAFWASLDPDHRKEFEDLARERGLYVLTEEPTAGDLRLENEAPK